MNKISVQTIHQTKNMLKAIIIDDERIARENLVAFINRLESDIQIVGQAENITEAYEKIQVEKPDFIFLDIEMPGGSGFDLLTQFDKIDFDVIFVTAYGHYAIQAIKMAAFGYIMKPIQFEELNNSIERILDKHQKEETPSVFNNMPHSLIQEFLSSMQKLEAPKKLYVPDMKGFSIIDLPKIQYCRADGNYTEIIMKEERLLCSKSLKDFQDILCKANRFYRINKSYIINPEFVQKYIKGSGGHVIMKDEHEIDVPRRGKEDFLQFMGIK